MTISCLVQVLIAGFQVLLTDLLEVVANLIEGQLLDFRFQS